MSDSAAKPGKLSYVTVYNRLREEILDTTLKPGAPIFEQELARRFNVSKSPIRDALLRLKEQRLVEVQPRRGYRVRPISLREAAEMYEMRHLYERACILRAVDHALPEDIARLRRICAAPETGSVAAWTAYNKVFHMALAEASGNQRLCAATCELVDQFDRFTFVSAERLSSPLDFSRLIEEHAAMVDAIEAGDRRRCQSLVRSHIADSERRIMAALAEMSVVE